jgi:outer membrane protein assembly factor BamB
MESVGGQGGVLEGSRLRPVLYQWRVKRTIDQMHFTSLHRLAVVLSVLSVAGCRKTPPVEEISAPATGVSEASPIDVSAEDWAWWRGQNGNATQPTMGAPTEFGPTQNVLWKAPVPGRGHADPTVVGDRVFLATAEEDSNTQSVVCFDRHSGNQLWQQTLHQGGFEGNVHAKSTQASNTVASDGQRLFVCLLNAGKIHLTCLDLEGSILWQKMLGDFRSKFGYSASPVLHGSLVIVAADHSDGGFLAGVHRESGDIVWKKARPQESTYASPIVAHVAGKDQVLIAGADQVASYSPETGEQLWSCEGVTSSCVGTVVWDENNVFASGGYPGEETICINASNGEPVWRNKQKVYISSLLAFDGLLFGHNDKGIAFCLDAATGEKKWQARLGGNHSASPVLIGQHIYAASEEGVVTIFEPSGDGFEVVAKNDMGDEIMASPVAAYGNLFLRVADHRGSGRQETLYCIGSGAGVTTFADADLAPSVDAE